MSDIVVVSRTQKIKVDAASGSVSVINAGPQGPVGPSIQRPNTKPEDYGTTGDGVADDTATLQAAMNAAGVGGTLELNADESYSVSLLTLSNDGVTVVGNGSTIIDRDGIGPTIDITGDRCSVLDVKIVGSDGSRVPGNDGIRFDGVDGGRVSGCDISKCQATGVFIQNSSNISVVDNHIHETYADCIHITNQSSQITVSNNKVGNNSGDDGIAIVGYQSDGGKCEDVAIVGNTIVNSATRGITVLGADRVTVSANVIRSCESAGIIVGYDGSYSTYGCTNTVITGNTVADTCKSINNGAIYIQGHGTQVSETILIIGNAIVDANFRGVAVSGGSVDNTKGVLIQSNTFTDIPNATCIYLNVGTPMTITNNSMLRVQDALAAIPTDAATMSLVISDNVCIDMNPLSVPSRRFFNAETFTFAGLSIIGNQVQGGDVQAMYRLPDANNAVIYGNTRDGVTADTFAGEPSTRGVANFWSGLTTQDVFAHEGAALGFFGETPTTKPNASDLNSLLAALDTLGLINDTS